MVRKEPGAVNEVDTTTVVRLHKFCQPAGFLIASTAMSIQIALSMFMLGFLGTGHCVGMCGPLVVSIPTQSGRFLPHLAYNTGRIITYTLIGAVLGSLGSGIEALAGSGSREYLEVVAGVQVAFSVFAGAMLLWLGLARIGLVAEPRWMAIPSPSKLPGFALIRRDATTGNSVVSAGLFGLVLGLLPCGLSYAAFARALAAQSTFNGAAMVFAFGLGTLPGLLVLGTGASRLFRKYRGVSDVLSGMLMLGMAAALLTDALTVYLSNM